MSWWTHWKPHLIVAGLHVQRDERGRPFEVALDAFVGRGVRGGDEEQAVLGVEGRVGPDAAAAFVRVRSCVGRALAVAGRRFGRPAGEEGAPEELAGLRVIGVDVAAATLAAGDADVDDAFVVGRGRGALEFGVRRGATSLLPRRLAGLRRRSRRVCRRWSRRRPGRRRSRGPGRRSRSRCCFRIRLTSRLPFPDFFAVRRVDRERRCLPG